MKCKSGTGDRAGLHVGIIMDGNGRWAMARGLPRAIGHRAGVEALRRACETAPELGVETLTVYAFSADNWSRPQDEVSALMGLLRRYLEGETARLIRDGIRLSAIGRRDRLPGGLPDILRRAEAATAAGDRLHLRIALDYSGREAILQAVSSLDHHERPDQEAFGALVTGCDDVRDVDLVIRTSGEQRLSDFLIWECAYAELYFTDTLWPDFSGRDLEHAISNFSARERRFGGRPGETPKHAKQTLLPSGPGPG
ncbi:MAG: di-trans,poly-cis-decaprenylcistransferase [Pseudomonadota bacterium]